MGDLVPVSARTTMRMMTLAGLVIATLLCVCSVTPISAQAAASSPGGVLVLTPNEKTAVDLPAGASSSVTLAATPFVSAPGNTTVTFRVTRGSTILKTSRPESLTQQLPSEGARSAEYTYADTAGAGTDTITATATANGRTIASQTTTIEWTLPPACSDEGLPSIFRSLRCTAALSFIANAYDTAGCIGAFVSAGRLSDAVMAADSAKGALRAAGNNSKVAALARDLAGLRQDGLTLRQIAATVHDAHSVKELVQDIWHLVKVATEADGSHATFGNIATALLDLAGFSSCVDLIENASTSAPTTHRPTPPSTSQVPLGTLCEGSGVYIDAVNGCPFNGMTPVGGGNFSYSILIESNDDSVSPAYWDLIDFPANTCQSISLSFAMPADGSAPGDVASIEVLNQSGAAQSASVAFGQTATLTASLAGGPWSLENSSTNANDQIAINGTATCRTSSGY
jgi:hypothetical protein